MGPYGANLGLIPVFIDSKSKDGLIRLMFLNNSINQAKFNYMAPVKEGANWVVWFYADIKEWKDPRQLKSDEIKFVEGFD